MKKLQGLYNDNANKIVKQAKNEKSAIKNLNVLIDLSMVTTDIKCVPEETKIFTEPWNHLNPNSCQNGEKPI